MTDPSILFTSLAAHAALLSRRLNWVVERLCALLMVLLILDVWLGVVVRYLIPLPLTFTEEAARYLMIWAALLAVSCGIARREHMGMQLLFDALPPWTQRALRLLFDLVAFGFFALLFVYGIGFTTSGARQFTMIYGMTKALPHAAVPTAAALCCIQLLLTAIRDQGRPMVPDAQRADAQGDQA